MRRPAIYVVLAIGVTATNLCGRCDNDPSDRRTVLRVANWGGPSVDASFMRTEREIWDEFERRHPDVRLQIENIPGFGQYVPKLLMTYVSGNPPDVISLDGSSAAVFINNDLLADLTPLIRKDKGFDLNDYFPNVLDIARRDGRLYAIPLDFTPMVMLYNRRIFDEAGVPYPRDGWTWKEFLETAKRLTVTAPGASTPTRFGFNFQKEMPLWFPWIWANGGDVLSPDGRHAVGYLDGPATVETITFLTDLIRKYRVAPSLSQSAAAGVDLFRAGRAAMTMTGHWSLIEYRVDKMDIGVTTIPTQIGRPVTVLYATGLAISRASRHKDLAWEYVKYLTSEAVQKKRVAGGLAISGNRKAAESFAGTPVEDAFLAQVKYARAPWGSRVESYELVEDLGREMIEDILNGGVPVKEAASRTARLIETELSGS
jgi:multiple sugar transport system substrate-binding protein